LRPLRRINACCGATTYPLPSGVVGSRQRRCLALEVNDGGCPEKPDHQPSLLNRIARVLLLLFLIPTTLILHGDVADKMERVQLFKDLAIIGGLLLVADQESKS